MSKKNKTKVTILALTLIGCMAVVGISAYFTDGDSVTNKFTVGSVEIDLVEPKWDVLPDTDSDEIPDAAEDMVPGQEVVKDPTIKNEGINDAYVFLKVKVPAAEVEVADLDGTAAAAKEFKELYEYTLNAGWVELEAYKETAADSVTHVYAYVGTDAATMEKLAAEGETPALFPAVRLINLTENNVSVPTAEQIDITAYAIQADNLNNGTDIDGTAGTAVTAPATVWDIIVKADPDTAEK